jgi:hypothetical protein
MVKEKLSRHKAEYGIAQKLQAFIAGVSAAVFVGIGAVGKCRFKKSGITEGVADFLLQSSIVCPEGRSGIGFSVHSCFSALIFM